MILRGPRGHMGTNWEPLEDHMGTNRGPLEDRMGTNWGPLEDHMGTNWGPLFIGVEPISQWQSLADKV